MDWLQMLKAMFVGTILRHNEVPSTGVRIHNIQYNQNTDKLELSVYYLNLNAKEGDLYYSDRDTLELSFPEFIRQFAYNKNSHIPDLRQADWIHLDQIIKEQN